ncbi:MAG: M3 family metallopeptidase [Pirellulaceae bacterium]
MKIPLYRYAQNFGLTLVTGASLIGMNFVSPAFSQDTGNDQKEIKVTNAIQEDSILLKNWTGPFGGIPPWDKVNPAEFTDAIRTAIESAKSDVNQIANSPDQPTFENTLVALETTGKTLNQVQAMFLVYEANLNTGPIPEIQKEVMPLFAEFEDWVIQNDSLFQRIASVHEKMKSLGLNEAQNRLLDDRYKTFVRNGAKLDASGKKRLSEINQRLATLFTEFSQNVLADEGGYITWISDQDDLAGLPESTVDGMAAAASEAREQGATETGQWAVTNTRSSMEPFLTYADNRNLREQVWRNYYSRCDHNDAKDNKKIISEILSLRAERAQLLGYETHAHWRLEPQMAKTPEQAMDLMSKVWPKAVQRVREEVADMQAVADSLGHNLKIEPWDYRYYAEKVRKAKYDLDFNEVKPYLQLDKIRDAMHWCAGEVYGLHFKQLDGVPVFHEDVSVWEVTDANGKHVGLWYFDPFARAGKRSGAWMTEYRTQENITNWISPIVSNNSNFVEGNPGEPVLISWDDAVTMFREFGHALHGLLSHVQYPSQAGTNVARDYVEFPSQINEHWLDTPEVLSKFLVHYKTGEPIPLNLLEKIEKASTFNQGFATVEYLASALIDMKLHLAGKQTIDPGEFERETLAELGMPNEIVMRHRTPHFSHVFADDGYSAGYYSYLWSDALTADAADVFEDAGSYFKPELCKRLYESVFSVGDTIDPAEGFRRFRGRDVDTKALLKKRGFPVDE